MPLLLDTGIVYAYYDAADSWHERALELLERESGPLLLPAPVIPELDHLLGRRLGRRARQMLYAGITEGTYLVVDLPADAHARVAEIDQAFEELDLGFVDCAVAVLAELLEVPRVATTDRRHFEPLARLLGLELLP